MTDGTLKDPSTETVHSVEEQEQFAEIMRETLDVHLARCSICQEALAKRAKKLAYLTLDSLGLYASTCTHAEFRSEAERLHQVFVQIMLVTEKRCRLDAVQDLVQARSDARKLGPELGTVNLKNAELNRMYEEIATLHLRLGDVRVSGVPSESEGAWCPGKATKAKKAKKGSRR